jgi:Holliday junction resolvasome RuvABC endonuclease subunit
MPSLSAKSTHTGAARSAKPAAGNKSASAAAKPSLLLALDASTTTVGWSLWDLRSNPGGDLRTGGTLLLNGKDVCQRFAAVELALEALCVTLRDAGLLPDTVAVERAAWGKSKAYTSRDEQQQAMGVIRKVLYVRCGITSKQTIRVSANTSKKQLTGYGFADKAQMMIFAQAHITGADEHCADSCGVALGAMHLLREG